MFNLKSIFVLIGIPLGLFLMIFGALVVTPAHAAGIRYATSNGTGDCSSWAKACTLQTALTGAASGDEIWAASGTYKPTTDTNRSISFTLQNGVALYGGFTGTETQRSQRDPAANVTILSGDIGISWPDTGNETDNSYHVVNGGGTDGTAVLDGFTVESGNASGAAPANGGGGMYNDGSSPTLANLIFLGNSADAQGGGIYNTNSSHPVLTNVTFNTNSINYLSGQASGGGGMYNNNSNPTLTNVTFSSNEAMGLTGAGMVNNGSSPALTNVIFFNNDVSGGSGGGMWNTNSSNPTLMNVAFISNRAKQGGGMGSNGSTPTLENVTFTINYASSYGGGMYNFTNSPTLTNVTFERNTALYGGGMQNRSSNPIMTNVTFTGNNSSYGGAMHNDTSSPQIRNSIFWGDRASANGAEIYNSTSTPYTLSDSVVTGDCPTGATCSNILTADPMLGTLGNYGGFTQTISLLSGSSAIDTGNDATCASTDQRGMIRPQGPHCDIGAYEAAFVQTSYAIFLPLVIK